MDNGVQEKPYMREDGLPENAYRKLKPGEKYLPVVPEGKVKWAK